MVLSRLGLPEAWRARAHYTLLDAKFGEGLNFLKLWAQWKQDPARPVRLHVVALSHSLVSASELAFKLRAQTSSEMHGLVEQLIQQWPLNLPGTHRMDFEGLSVTLTLVVGPLAFTLPRLAAQVDAVLLNEEAQSSEDALASVWRQALPGLGRDPAQIVLVYPNGQVVRGLGFFSQEAAAGKVTRGGVVVAETASDRLLRHNDFQGSARSVLVVGAGIAGAGVAQAMALRGWRVQVLDDRARRLREHRQHVAAALTPMVTRDDDIRARLSRSGSLRAQARWSHVGQDILWRCGALQLQRVTGRIVDLADVLAGLSLPPEWVRYVDAVQASAIAGMALDRGGLYFPTAARIQPEKLIGALLQTPGIECLDVHVDRIQRRDGHWQALDEQGEVRAEASQLILAGAQGTQDILIRSQYLEPEMRLAAMHPLGGEITLLPDTALAAGPRCIVSGDGYVLPALDGQCVVGSSYIHGAQQVEPSLDGALGNVARAAGLLGQPGLAEAFNISRVRALTGWAGWRAVLPGRLPAVGPVAHTEGLWTLTGFASRGLTWASLAGDLLAASLNGEPLPLERDIMDKISQT